MTGYWPVSSALSGDVDGDGRPDRVYVAAAEGNPCDLLLVLEGAAYSSQRFEIPCEKRGEAIAMPPFVKVLADIDRVPGLEILVEIGHGASRTFARLFTIRDRRVHPMTIEGQTDRLTIEYGGSAGTGETFVDCAARKGFVLLTSRTMVERTIVRTRLRVVGTSLAIRGSKRFVTDRGFRELRGRQPFPRCARARR